MSESLVNKTIARIFIISAVLLVLIGVNVFQFYSNKTKIERMEKTFSEEYLEMNSLLPETFKQEVISGKKFVALIGRPGCPSCRAISRDFIELLENHELNTKIYYVNVTSIRKSGDDPEWIKFKSDCGNIPGTPALVLAEYGKITSSLSWTDDGDLTVGAIENWLRDIGYIHDASSLTRLNIHLHSRRGYIATPCTTLFNSPPAQGSSVLLPNSLSDFRKNKGIEAILI